MTDFERGRALMDFKKRRALIEDLRTRLTDDEFETLLRCLRSELGYGPELVAHVMRQMQDHPVSSEMRARWTEEAQAEADRLRQEEAEGLGWCDPFVKRMPPPHNPDVDVYVATDLLKYVYAKLTRELAHLQYDMADYVAAGKLDREANDDLQGWCVSAWEFLYHNTTAAIRNWDTDDRNWDAADNTYWNGLQVMTQVRIEPPETREHHHPNNQYIHGDGATNEYQRGVVYYIAQPPNHPNVARDRRWNRRRR